MRKSLFYVKVGWTYVCLEQNKLAVDNFRFALKDSAKITVKVYNTTAHQGLGYAYYKWEKYDKALHHDSIALAFFRKTDNRLFIQALLNNMADVFVATKQLSEAIRNNSEASSIAHEINNSRAIGSTMLTFTEIAIAKNNYQQAKDSLLSLLNSPVRYKINRAGRVRLYGLLADILEKESNTYQAYHFLNLQKQVNDSLTKSKLANISRIDLKYQIEKKKRISRKRISKKKDAVFYWFFNFCNYSNYSFFMEVLPSLS